MRAGFNQNRRKHHKKIRFASYISDHFGDSLPPVCTSIPEKSFDIRPGPGIYKVSLEDSRIFRCMGTSNLMREMTFKKP